MVRNRIVGLSSQVVITNISQRTLSGILVPITTEEEQRVIVEKLGDYLSIISRSENEISRNLKRAEILRQTILKKAFEGKFMLQDQKDEPIGMLLERLKGE